MDLNIIILAAGKGTRMKSTRAKVLHEVFFSPMIHHVVDAVFPLKAKKIIVVTGHQKNDVEEALKKYPVTFTEQKEQLGTGHAVLAAEKTLDQPSGVIMVLCGDTPVIRTETLDAMLRDHVQKQAQLTVMTTKVANPTNYGRIVTDHRGAIRKIVEEKDASPEQKTINEINAGIYCVNGDILFSTLKEVGTENAQGEVYLTDIVEIAIGKGWTVNHFCCTDAQEVLGINSRVDLAYAHGLFRERRNQALMIAGVTLLDPATAWIEKGVAIGTDTLIYPNVHILGATTIGKCCVIEPGCMITRSSMGDNVHIGACSILADAKISDKQHIAPGSFLGKSETISLWKTA